nr:hypothetical protein [Flexivirga aerilata]
MSGPVEGGVGGARPVPGERELIGIADHRVLPSRDDQAGPVEPRHRAFPGSAVVGRNAGEDSRIDAVDAGLHLEGGAAERLGCLHDPEREGRLGLDLDAVDVSRDHPVLRHRAGLEAGEHGRRDETSAGIALRVGGEQTLGEISAVRLAGDRERTVGHELPHRLLHDGENVVGAAQCGCRGAPSMTW